MVAGIGIRADRPERLGVRKSEQERTACEGKFGRRGGDNWVGIKPVILDDIGAVV